MKLSDRKAARLTILLALLCGAIAHAADDKKPDSPPTQMKAFVVREQSKMAFGFGVDIWKNGESQKIFALYVKSVKAESEAEGKGLRPRTRILSIDGREIEAIDATFEAGSELFKKFVGRKRGDKVVLEILSAGDQAPHTVVLTEK
jgi:C-terminal processing protease CtpA/Prc